MGLGKWARWKLRVCDQSTTLGPSCGPVVGADKLWDGHGATVVPCICQSRRGVLGKHDHINGLLGTDVSVFLQNRVGGVERRGPSKLCGMRSCVGLESIGPCAVDVSKEEKEFQTRRSKLRKSHLLSCLLSPKVGVCGEWAASSLSNHLPHRRQEWVTLMAGMQCQPGNLKPLGHIYLLKKSLSICLPTASVA